MMARRLLRWFFLNRKTGEVTIAQAPNLTLWIVILTGFLLWLWPDTDKASFALTVVFKGGLLVWAASEIACGVNPWRRCLGAGVAAYVLMTVLR
jgi:hypothetical protein